MSVKKQTIKEQPVQQLVVSYLGDDGITSNWYYNSKKTLNGPIKVELAYPPNFFTSKVGKVKKK